MLEGQHNLSQIETGILLGEGDFLLDVVVQVFTGTVIDNQIQEVGSLKSVMELDNELVVRLLKH